MNRLNRVLTDNISKIDDNLIAMTVRKINRGKKRKTVLNTTKYVGIAAAFAAICFTVPFGIEHYKDWVSSQRSTSDSGTTEISDIQYSYVNIDCPFYKTAEELVSKSTTVLTAKVTGVRFEVVDNTTGKAPADKISGNNYALHTVYEIQSDQIYKNSLMNVPERFSVYGGLEGIYLEEQAAALAGNIEKTIPIIENAPEINIGERYLLVLTNIGGSNVLTSFYQGVYDIDNPAKFNMDAKKIEAFCEGKVLYYENADKKIMELDLCDIFTEADKHARIEGDFVVYDDFEWTYDALYYNDVSDCDVEENNSDNTNNIVTERKTVTVKLLPRTLLSDEQIYEKFSEEYTAMSDFYRLAFNDKCSLDNWELCSLAVKCAEFYPQYSEFAEYIEGRYAAEHNYQALVSIDVGTNAEYWLERTEIFDWFYGGEFWKGCTEAADARGFEDRFEHNAITKFIMPEYFGVKFELIRDKGLCANGEPLFYTDSRVFLCDLNGDGKRELIAGVKADDHTSLKAVYAYDFKDKVLYELVLQKDGNYIEIWVENQVHGEMSYSEKDSQTGQFTIKQELLTFDKFHRTISAN